MQIARVSVVVFTKVYGHAMDILRDVLCEYLRWEHTTVFQSLSVLWTSSSRENSIAMRPGGGNYAESFAYTEQLLAWHTLE
jgi:hypothetical protein